MINDYYKEASMSLSRPNKKTSGTGLIVSTLKSWVTGSTTLSVAADGEVEVVDPNTIPDPDLSVFQRRNDVKDEDVHRLGQWYKDKFCRRTKAHGNQDIAERMILFTAPTQSARECGIAIGQAFVDSTRRNWSFSEPGELSTLLSKVLLAGGYGFTPENLKKPVDPLEWFVLNTINEKFAKGFALDLDGYSPEQRATLKTTIPFKQFQEKDVVGAGQWYKEQFVSRTSAHGNQDIADDCIKFTSPNKNSRECALAIADACFKAIRRNWKFSEPGEFSKHLVEILVQAGFGLTKEDFFNKPVDTAEFFVKNKINEAYAVVTEAMLDEFAARNERPKAYTSSYRP